MSNADIVAGTLDLLVLNVLSQGPLHGYAIAKSIRRDSEEVLRVGDNTLYPALHRLEARGDLSGAWGRTSTGREARIYTLTARGEKRLTKEAARWMERSRAALRILSGEG